MILIATVGQLFCGAAGLTSASRTWYAFSRDRGMPGWGIFRRVNRDRVPFNAVIAVSVFSLIIAIPALFGKNDYPVRVLRADRDLHGRPLPRLHHPGLPAAAQRATRSSPGRGTSAPLPDRQHRSRSSSWSWSSISLNLPYTPAGLPWNDGFDTSLVNYTPLAIVVPLIFGIWYLVSAKDTYQGPVRTLEEDVVTRD